MKQESVEARRSDKGYTLVELLIVIVILGILATVTVFAVKGMTDKAKTNTCAQDRKSMEVAVEGYFANTGSYAISGADLVPTFLRAASPNYDTDSSGAVTPLTPSPDACT